MMRKVLMGTGVDSLTRAEAVRRWNLGSEVILAGERGDDVCLFVGVGVQPTEWFTLTGEFSNEPPKLRLFSNRAEFTEWLAGDTSVGAPVRGDAEATLKWADAEEKWRYSMSYVLGAVVPGHKDVAIFTVLDGAQGAWRSLDGDQVHATPHDVYLFDTSAEFLKWAREVCGD